MKALIRLVSITTFSILTCMISLNALASESMKASLDRIEAEYNSLPTETENAEKFYALDRELRALVAKANKEFPGELITHQTYLQREQLGVFIEQAAGNSYLMYRGTIMNEADRVLPPYTPPALRNNHAPRVRGEKFTFLKDKLERIYVEYSALKMQKKDIETLYKINKEIPVVVKQIYNYYTGFSEKFWEPKYSEIGLDIEKYSEQLNYSGKLLLDLHKIDSHSIYRDETLWASQSSPPTIESLNAYIAEYPNGKYIASAYYELAGFYYGLHDYLRYVRNNPEEMAGEYSGQECFEPYVSRQPENQQIQEAQQKGIDLYQKGLRVLSTIGKVEEWTGQRNHIQDELAKLRLGEPHVGEWCYRGGD
jgi:hypothetical protein